MILLIMTMPCQDLPGRKVDSRTELRMQRTATNITMLLRQTVDQLKHGAINKV